MATRSLSPALLRPVLVAALLIAVVPGLTLLRGQAKEQLGLPAAELYVADGLDLASLAQYDAATLAPVPDRPAASLGPAGDESLPVLSADGSTSAFAGNDGTVVVRDGLMGPERLRFFPDGTVGKLALSRDGRRLVAEVVADYSGANLTPPAWKVFDTGDGRLVATVENAEPGDPWAVWVVDADAERLYRLAFADGGGEELATEPHTTVLIAHDLASGAEVGRLELPQVRAGFWQSDERVAIGGGEEFLMRELLPALAASPDGRHLAIAHADEDMVTLIDTSELGVERTTRLAKAESGWSRVLGFLPLVPRSAAAKALEGTMLQAVFSPDGRHLYITGVQSTVEDGQPIARGLGLRAVDAATGEVEAEGLNEALIERVVPSPDGGSLYVAGPASDPANGAVPYRLMRLDAATLEVDAGQTFPEWRWFVVRSALADPTLPLTVEMVEMAFLPSLVSVPADTPVRLTIANHGTVLHTLHTGDGEDDGWDLRIEVQPRETATIVIHVPAGEYKLFCDVAGHPEAGMGGAIVAR